MNDKKQELWDQFRTGYRPQVPDLDVAAIMGAIRREAAAHPLRRADSSPVMAIPTWVCAMAASLAILAAASVVARSVTVADNQIGLAWLRSIQPAQFEQSILNFSDSSL
jgi:hypothetical protein